MLYLVATPIGNLSDITLRALEALKECDYILCEDTRHSLTLLNHYEIRKPLKSYHQFNESSQVERILTDLQDGKKICLISDAGTPGISDPGEILVKACIAAQIPLTALPGPCAAINAISCSGLPTERFQFMGFLPRKEGELRKILYEILSYHGTSICYESPHRLLDVLKLLNEIDPLRQLVVGRELTKRFEEFRRGTASELLLHWEKEALKGELVLLFSPAPADRSQNWETLTPKEHVHWIETTYGLSTQEAIKIVADMRGVPKREIYKTIHLDP